MNATKGKIIYTIITKTRTAFSHQYESSLAAGLGKPKSMAGRLVKLHKLTSWARLPLHSEQITAAGQKYNEPTHMNMPTYVSMLVLPRPNIFRELRPVLIPTVAFMLDRMHRPMPHCAELFLQPSCWSASHYTHGDAWIRAPTISEFLSKI